MNRVRLHLDGLTVNKLPPIGAGSFRRQILKAPRRKREFDVSFDEVIELSDGYPLRFTRRDDVEVQAVRYLLAILL